MYTQTALIDGFPHTFSKNKKGKKLFIWSANYCIQFYYIVALYLYYLMIYFQTQFKIV